MHGNMAEFCQDWEGPIPTDRLTIDPNGVGQGDARIVRSYGFIDSADAVRSDLRAALTPHARLFQIGFRVVCEIAE